MGLLFTFYFQRKLGFIFCDSLETSSLIFSEKKEKYLGMSSAAVMIGASRVNRYTVGRQQPFKK